MGLFTILPVNRMLVLIQLAVSFLSSGCGTNSLPRHRSEPLEQSIAARSQKDGQLDEKTQRIIDQPKQDSLPSLCKGFEVTLFERPIRMEHRALELTSTSSLTLESPKLAENASTDNRCEEIEKNFSGALSMYNGGMIRRMTLFVFKFEPTTMQENQLKNGESIVANPNKVQIEFTDGQYNHLNKDISISCPRLFELSCEYRPADGKNCASYVIRYPDQVCKLQAKFMPYSFSDQQRQAINLDGEIRLSAHSGNLLAIKEIRW